MAKALVFGMLGGLISFMIAEHLLGLEGSHFGGDLFAAVWITAWVATWEEKRRQWRRF